MTGSTPSAPPLRYRTYEDALLVPSPSRSVYRDIDGAVFDAELRPIEGSLLKRSWKRPNISFHPDIEGLDLAGVEVVEEPHVYGGYFFDHFGHFLLESLARAWVVAEVGALPFAWAAGDPPNAWQSEILSLLGLTMPHRFPRRPTVFRRLVIPEPGYRIQTFFHPRHARFLGRWNASARADETPDQAPSRVWLSRTNVGNPDRRSSGEEVLQDGLAARGWHIFHPQRASIAEQLRTVGGAAVVAGLEGSAFHTAALLERPACRFVALRRGTNSNYRTIAERKGIVEFDLYGAYRVRDRRDRRLARPKRWAGIVDGLAQRIEEAEGEPARLEALRTAYEARYDFENWDRRQARRWTAPRARAFVSRARAFAGRVVNRCKRVVRG